MRTITNSEKLPNFDRLGFGKVMFSEFVDKPKSELSTPIDSGYFEHPHLTNKPIDGEYCEVVVFDCQSDQWWYKDLIGYRFFCQVVYGNYGYGRFIKSFRGVKLSNNKMVVFREFDPKDVLIV